MTSTLVVRVRQPELIETQNPDWRDLSDEWFEALEGLLSWLQRP